MELADYERVVKAVDAVWAEFGNLEILTKELGLPLNVGLFDECFHQVEGELMAEIEEQEEELPEETAPEWKVSDYVMPMPPPPWFNTYRNK